MITDLDRSGKNSDRPGLQEILLMARNREIDHVLVQYIDRNYRNGLSMLKFYEKLGEYGVSILSVHENINTKDFQGRFMALPQKSLFSLTKGILKANCYLIDSKARSSQAT